MNKALKRYKKAKYKNTPYIKPFNLARAISSMVIAQRLSAGLAQINAIKSATSGLTKAGKSFAIARGVINTHAAMLEVNIKAVGR